MSDCYYTKSYTIDGGNYDGVIECTYVYSWKFRRETIIRQIEDAKLQQSCDSVQQKDTKV